MKQIINKQKNNNKYLITSLPVYGGDFKIIIIGTNGNDGTNKAEFMNKYNKNVFSNLNHTIVNDFGFKILEYDGYSYRINFWDLISPDKKNYKVPEYFAKDFHGVVIMSSATNIQSRNDCLKWKKSVDEIAIFPDGKELPCILVENNINMLLNNERFDPIFEEFWKKNGFTKGFRVSSKTGENVNESIDYLVKEIIKRMKIIKKEIETPSRRQRKDKNCLIF